MPCRRPIFAAQHPPLHLHDDAKESETQIKSKEVRRKKEGAQEKNGDQIANTKWKRKKKKR
jgi:hypothetical protein